MKKYWIEFLEKNATLYADKVAIVDQRWGKNYTYQELNTLVNAWAFHLQKEGLKKHDTFCFYAPHNRGEHLILMLAAAKISALFVPLNFRLAINEIEDVINRCEAKLFLGVGENKFHVSSPYIDVEKVELDLEALPEFQYATMNDAILMLFTSGSTGVPKGVMFHGEMLFSNQVETCRHWGLLPSDVTLVETPFFHTGGYNVLLLPLLYLGGTSIIAKQFSPENVFHCIEKEKVSVYFAVPTMFQLLAEDPQFSTISLASIRFFISGGAACPLSLIERYQKRGPMFKQGFGLTEVGPNCFLLDEKMAIKKIGSIGVPMAHSQVRVKNGELQIKGPHVCKGYFKNDDLFLNSLEDGYFKTGDLVTVDEDGYFYVVGRLKDMYISGGENVYPGEVEKQLTTYPGINEAVVVPVPHEKWGEVGLLYYTGDRELKLEDLKLFLGDKLSKYKHPFYLKCLDSFPLLPNGKIDRKILKEKKFETGING